MNPKHSSLCLYIDHIRLFLLLCITSCSQPIISSIATFVGPYLLHHVFNPYQTHEPTHLWCNAKATNGRLSSLSAQDRRPEWSSAGKTDEVAASEKPRDHDHDADDAVGEVAWRPAVRPAEVTITDVTLNSLTVTFRESRMPKGFFRDWGLKI